MAADCRHAGSAYSPILRSGLSARVGRGAGEVPELQRSIQRILDLPGQQIREGAAGPCMFSTTVLP
jgi:hypothetical protein